MIWIAHIAAWLAIAIAFGILSGRGIKLMRDGDEVTPDE